MSYLKGDPTSVEIKLKFTDLVDDPACHKVGNVSLVLREKNDVSTQPGVNFINVLCTAFALEDPKSVKNAVESSVSFYAFGIYERKSCT